MILDTNILLEQLSDNGTILYSVLCELDRQKTLDGEIGYKARRAIRNIKRGQFNLQYFELLPNEHTDDNLIRYCLEYGETLCTKDLSLALKATAKEVGVEFVEFGRKVEYDPTYYPKTEEQLADFFTGNATFDYAIIDNGAYKNRGLPQPISWGTLETSKGTVKARNPHQAILLDNLFNQTKKVVSCVARAGTGKSYLMLSYAVEQLERKRIKKIVVVSNNSQTNGSREIGALPGTIFEKEAIYCAPLLNIYSLLELEQMWENGTIEIVPLALMRGRSFNDAIIYVSEAQNLTVSHIKLLLARVGENCRIFFDGDVKQIDNYKFKESSGLEMLAKLHKEKQSNLIAYCTLHKVERSEVAQLADLIDEQ